MKSTGSDRYKVAPIKRFVDTYVLDVVGALSPEASSAMGHVDLQRIFNTMAADWRGALRETLDLSETFDIAILDLWYRWVDATAAEGRTPSPQEFAAGFTDNYFVEGSKIDVWTPESLEAAKARIASARQTH